MNTPRNSCVLGILVVLLLNVGQHALAAPAKDVMDRARLEKMLADGDTDMIVQVFRRHPNMTLPFIDRYLEGGLAMIEKGESQDMALQSFRTGIKFAALADEAFAGSTFSDYANSFASFSPSEQKQFREGQKAFKEGMKENDPKNARKRLEESLTLAQSLGDTWGQAMALTGLAEKAQKSGDMDEALGYADQAIKLNRALQLREDCVQSLLLAANVSSSMPAKDSKIKEQSGPSSIDYLEQAFALVAHDPDMDEELRTNVLGQYVAALEAAGMKNRASEAKREFRNAVHAPGATTAPAN